MRLCRWEHLNLTRYCAKLNAYRACETGDLTLFCHVRSRERMIKGTSDLAKGSLSGKVSTLPSLVVAGLVEVDV